MDYEYNKKMAEDLIREMRDKRKEVEREKRANIEDELKEIKPEQKENPDILNEGYFLLYKKIIKSPIWQDARMLQLWIYCLARANFQSKQIFFNGVFFDIERGQFISSIKHIAKDCCLTAMQTRGRLNTLKRTNKITIKTTNKFTLISVINYAHYQDRQQTKQQIKQQSSNKPITNQQQQRTNITKRIKKKRVFFIESFLNDTQKKCFKNKPEFYKEKLLSVADYDVILVSCYLLEARNFGSEVELNVYLKKDRTALAHSLTVISKVKDKEWLVIMANLRKNGRLSVENCASAINARNNRA